MADETTLILEQGTLELLRHLEPIVSDGAGAYIGGFVLVPGNDFRVANKVKRLAARATLPQTIERGFAVYNAERWLRGALAPFSRPKLTFATGYMTISEADATERGLSIRYPICDASYITTITKDPELEAAFAFPLLCDQLKQILEIAGNLTLPNLVLHGTKGQLLLGAIDVEKHEDGKLGAKLPIGKTDRNFTLAFRTSDFRKLKAGDDYKIAIAFSPDTNDDGAAHVVSADGTRHYWLLAQAAPSGPAAKKARQQEE